MLKHRFVVPAALLALFLVMSLAQPLTAEIKAPGKLDTNVKAPQTFRYKHKAGEINSFDAKIDQGVKMTGQAAPGLGGMNVTSVMKAQMDMRTDKVLPSGDAVVITTYGTFDLTMNQGGQVIESPQLAQVADMVRKIKTTATVTPRGEQKDIKMEGLPAEMRQLQDSLSNAMVGATPTFPEKGLKPGEGWQQDMPVDLQQGPVSVKMDFQIKYTFMGYSTIQGTRVAVFKTDLKMVIKNTTSNMMGIEMNISGGGKGTGFIYFDQQGGRLMKSDTEMVQNIDMEIKAPEGPQKLQMEMSTDAAIDRKK